MLALIQKMFAVKFLMKMLCVIAQRCTVNISVNENKKKNDGC